MQSVWSEGPSTTTTTGQRLKKVAPLSAKKVYQTGKEDELRFLRPFLGRLSAQMAVGWGVRFQNQHLTLFGKSCYSFHRKEGRKLPDTGHSNFLQKDGISPRAASFSRVSGDRLDVCCIKYIMFPFSVSLKSYFSYF